MSRYIDADNLVDKIDERLDTVGYCTIGKGLSYYGELIGCIKDTPTANVEEVKHGEWIANPSMDDRYSKYYTCSVCGRLEQVSHSYDIKEFSPYCHCGAKMDGGTNETD